MFYHFPIHVEYPYRGSRRSPGIVRARAWYGAGLGDYSPNDLLMILRRNFPRGYRGSGARFAIFPRTPGIIFKNKKKINIVGGGENWRDDHRSSRGLVLIERNSRWGYRPVEKSPVKKHLLTHPFSRKILSINPKVSKKGPSLAQRKSTHFARLEFLRPTHRNPEGSINASILEFQKGVV